MVSYDQLPLNIPEKWTPLKKQTMKGGQATAIPVRHEDGREGVYREIRERMSGVSRERFQRELEILSRKVQHRSIVTLFDWTADIEQPWYISELGDPFDKWWLKWKRNHDQDPETLVDQAVSILLELSSALSICHENGIVHRDIKPKNLVMKKGVAAPWPILIDFGIAHYKDGDRLTPTDQAVGNARFSPDIMRSRLEDISPWLDVFDLGQLLTWMLDEHAPKNHWQRPVHWKYAVYGDGMPVGLQRSIKAFTAVCFTENTSPANGRQVVDLLGRLFRPPPQKNLIRIDTNAIADAKRRGEAMKLLANTEIQEEINSSAPLARIIYFELRETLLTVFEEVSEMDNSAEITLDEPFSNRINGATDLFWMKLGPPTCNIQLRIKTKVVPWCDPLPHNKPNRDFWQKHMPMDTICITFALEGGVAQAADTRYMDGRWITVRRDGSIYLHSLSASLQVGLNGDLAGSANDDGVPGSMSDVRAFAISIFTKEKYWEYITMN